MFIYKRLDLLINSMNEYWVNLEQSFDMLTNN